MPLTDNLNDSALNDTALNDTALTGDRPDAPTDPGRQPTAERIIVLVKRFPRLSETFILNEFLELRRRGLPVELFAIMDPGESRSQPEALALVPEVVYLQSASLWRELPAALRTARRHPAGSLRAAWWALTRRKLAAGQHLIHALVLLDRLEGGPPAHLHAHFLHAPAVIALLAEKISGLTYSLEGHAKDIYTTPPEDLRRRCARAVFVSTCTEANREYLLTEVGLAPGLVQVCRHGVDLATFAVPDRKPRAGRIVAVGRLVPKKGFDTLIRACGELGRRGVRFDLVILGGGDLHDELVVLAREVGIGDRVRILGSRPQAEVVEQLAEAEIFALSPRILPDGDRDGVPNVLLEAMAAGVPVVATAVSGIPEMVTDGQTGRLVPPQRPDLLADVLAGLLADPAERARLGAAGQRQVREHANWDTAITPLLSALGDRLALPAVEPVEPSASAESADSTEWDQRAGQALEPQR